MDELLGDSSLIERGPAALLARRAREHPERTALAFHAADGSTLALWTYAELDRRARAVGARLADEGLAGRPVLLLLPNGLDFFAAFFGCLYAGALAAPTYSPHPSTWLRTLPRIRSIAEDAGATAGITTVEARDAMLRILGPSAGGIRWSTLEELAARRGSVGGDPVGDPDRPALIQYSSGSVGAPRGVVVSHANLAANLEMTRLALGAKNPNCSTWLPAYHDLGLIGNMLEALWRGGECRITAPTSFLSRPRVWLESFARHGCGIVGMPNFAFEHCVRRVAARERVGLDLSGLTCAYNGGELVHAETAEAFTQAYADAGFVAESFAPAYGLSEATMLVAATPFGRGPRVLGLDRAALQEGRAVTASAGDSIQRVVSDGAPVPGQEWAVVDSAAAVVLAERRVGELWVRGPHVAAGYWRRPADTEKSFGARLAGDRRPWLRTGDLAFLDAGELFVCGRIKDVIIVQGRKHYPEDLEWTAERAHAGVRPAGAAAFPVAQGASEGIALVLELEHRGGRADAMEVEQAVRRAILEEHGVAASAVVFVKAGSLPKTSNGKVRRGAVSRGFQDENLRRVG